MSKKQRKEQSVERIINNKPMTVTLPGDLINDLEAWMICVRDLDLMSKGKHDGDEKEYKEAERDFGASVLHGLAMLIGETLEPGELRNTYESMADTLDGE